MTDYLLYLYAESPVHTGAAGSLDALDLPVQREAATGYPVIWGQSLKGALRQAASDTGWDPAREIVPLFGSAAGDRGGDGGTTPGTLTVGDAQLVAMPVPTLRHTFAWATSPLALSRLARKYKALRLTAPNQVSVRSSHCLAPASTWVTSAREVLGPLVVQFEPEPSPELAAWGERLGADALAADEVFGPFRDKLREDLVLAGADLMPVLLRECTEQAVRVQLSPDEKKVKNGPFYSEYLPAETILAATLTLRGRVDERLRDRFRGLLHEQLLQVGGDETLGKGLVWGRLVTAAS